MMPNAPPRNYFQGSVTVRVVLRGRRWLDRAVSTWWRRLALGEWTHRQAALVEAHPLQLGGLALTAAVLTHRGMVWLMGKDGTPLARLIGMTLLAIGVMGLFLDSDWRTIRHGSVFMTLWERWKR